MTKPRKAYEEGLSTMSKHNNERNRMSFLVNLAILYNLQGQPDTALMLCRESLEIAKEAELSVTSSDIFNEVAKALLIKAEMQSARDTVALAIEFAQEGHSLEKEIQAWETQSRIQQASGEYDKALESLQMHRILSDSMFIKEKTAEIDRLQIEYERDKQEQEIGNLRAQAELQKEKTKWLVVGLASLALAALVIVYGFIQKRKKDRVIHQGELELKSSENQRLEELLEHKRRELTDKALHLAQKNELLNSLKKDLQDMQVKQPDNGAQVLSNKIRFDEQIDNNWEQFMKAFTETNQNFSRDLLSKHAGITSNELRLSALLSMNLSSKDIGGILSISDAGVKKARYRLRKKLQLETSDSLEHYLASFQISNGVTRSV